MYTWYKLGRDKVKVSILHYVNDTLIIGDATQENVVIIKNIMQNFELVFRSNVNFQK